MSVSSHVPGPVGPLQARFTLPPNPKAGQVAVICHPHPLYGGAMDNKVVSTLERACRESGLPVAVFNFRGVGTLYVPALRKEPAAQAEHLRLFRPSLLQILKNLLGAIAVATALHHSRQRYVRLQMDRIQFYGHQELLSGRIVVLGAQVGPPQKVMRMRRFRDYSYQFV